MTIEEAERALDGIDLVPCAEASLAEARELVELFLASEVPAALGARNACAKPGCAPRVQVMIRPDDRVRATALLDQRWQELLRREGTLPSTVAQAARVEGEPPCPACGTAAPLVKGACRDCGLQLE